MCLIHSITIKILLEHITKLYTIIYTITMKQTLRIVEDHEKVRKYSKALISVTLAGVLMRSVCLYAYTTTVNRDGLI